MPLRAIIHNKILYNMTTPQYQFNLGNADPVLSGRDYSVPKYFENIDEEINRLNELKSRLHERQYPIKQTASVWDEIDKEVSALTNEQQNILGHDETYISIDRELQAMIQYELINSVKYKIENSKRGKELLESQLKNIKDKKKQIVDASNKEMELFKKFQIAVQANPNLTYAEFIKNIK